MDSRRELLSGAATGRPRVERLSGGRGRPAGQKMERV